MFFGGCSCAGMCHSNLDAHFDCFPFSLPLVSFANASTNLNLKDILPKSSQANSCKAYSNIYIINLLWYFSVQIAFLVVPFKIPGTKLNGTWDVCVAQFFRNANNFQLLWFHNIGNVQVFGYCCSYATFFSSFCFCLLLFHFIGRTRDVYFQQWSIARQNDTCVYLHAVLFRRFSSEMNEIQVNNFVTIRITIEANRKHPHVFTAKVNIVVQFDFFRN